MFLLGSGLGVEFLRLSLSLASAPLCLLRSGSPLRSEYVYSRCCSVSPPQGYNPCPSHSGRVPYLLLLFPLFYLSYKRFLLILPLIGYHVLVSFHVTLSVVHVRMGFHVHRADAHKCPPTDAHMLHNNWQRHGSVLTCIYCADTIYLRSARSPNINHSRLAILIALLRMHFINILSLTLSFLGIYNLVISLRYLIPCYIIPFLSVHLDSTQQLLNHAKAINAIPPESEYRTHLGLSVALIYIDTVWRTDSRRCVWRVISPGGPSSNCILLFCTA